jgi:hypothetical protein
LADKTIENIQVVIGNNYWNILSNNVKYNISWWITYNEWMEIDDDDTAFIPNDIAVIKVIEN